MSMLALVQFSPLLWELILPRMHHLPLEIWRIHILCGITGGSYIPPPILFDLLTISTRKFWHQLLRQPFTSLSNFITRDVLCLPRSSLIERYANVFIVFLFSGLLHLFIDVGAGISAQESGAMLYFLSFVLGFMIEDGVKAMWKSVFPLTKEYTGPPPIWQRAVRFVWTMGWIGVISTRYFVPVQRPELQSVLVPFNVTDRIGLPALVGVVGVGAAFLQIVFEVEI